MRVVFRWIFGFLVATFLTWVMGWFACSEIGIWRWVPSISDWTYCDESRFWFSEGRGTVYFDSLGIQGAREPLSPDQRHVVFWGDSEVEAFNVGDEGAMYTAFTELARDENLRGVALGRSGRDLGTFAARCGVYSPLIPRVDAHVIVFSLNDTLPNGKTLLADGSPPYRYEPFNLSSPRLRDLFHRAHAQSFWMILSTMKRSLPNLRFRVGPVAPPADAPEPPVSAQSHRPFWDRLLSTLARQQEQHGRILMVYTPKLPRLVDGEVTCEDPDRQQMDEFVKMAEEKGIAVLDMTSTFTSTYEETGQLPRGFANSYPGEGHLNALGHRLIAEQVLDRIQDMNPSTEDQ